MANENLIIEIMRDIEKGNDVLKNGDDQEICKCFYDLKETYTIRNKNLSFPHFSKSSMSALHYALSRGVSHFDNTTCKEDLEKLIRLLEFECAELKDKESARQESLVINNTNHNNLSCSITLTSTLKQINTIPKDSLTDKDRDKLEKMLHLIDNLQPTNKEKIKGKISEILKFIADKSVDVGIATIPYLFEITKKLQ